MIVCDRIYDEVCLRDIFVVDRHSTVPALANSMGREWESNTLFFVIPTN